MSDFKTNNKDGDEFYDRRSKSFDEKFCESCGAIIKKEAEMCVKCGVRQDTQNSVSTQTQSKSRLTYVLLGVFLGTLGIHNFYAGYTGRAIAQLLISIFLGWLIIPIFAVLIWAIIEVIAIKNDAQGANFS